MAAREGGDTLASRPNEDKERLLLNTTPESVAAHLRELADMAPQAGAAEAIARRRSERRKKLSRFAATIYHAIPFVKRAGETELAPTEPKPAI